MPRPSHCPRHSNPVIITHSDSSDVDRESPVQSCIHSSMIYYTCLWTSAKRFSQHDSLDSTSPSTLVVPGCWPDYHQSLESLIAWDHPWTISLSGSQEVSVQQLAPRWVIFRIVSSSPSLILIDPSLHRHLMKDKLLPSTHILLVGNSIFKTSVEADLTGPEEFPIFFISSRQ